MKALVCDFCGGGLIIDDSREFAICEFCGTKYMASTLRQKIQEIRGTVSVEGEVSVKQADFVIRAGVLEKYNGSEIDVVIPNNVSVIGAGAFAECKGLKSVCIPNGVTDIENHAFYNCVRLIDVTLPDSLVGIGDFAFAGCESLERINLPEHVLSIGGGAFSNCPCLYFIGQNYTAYIDRLDEIFFGTRFLDDYDNLTRQRRAEDLCQYCGGTFRGLFSKTCVNCGRLKDY